uniref:Uncharacterized protein n=1 Tax=Amphimedon queenslandica TaxID=400682 RepID=A0A1X7V8I6_AMPQE
MLCILYETIKQADFCAISILVRGNDDISGEELFKGTSKPAEGFRAKWVLKKAVNDKTNISIHVQDNDSTSSKVLLSNFPNCRIILCSGHIARNHEKHLKGLDKQQLKKCQIKKYQKTHPDIATVKCHCMKDDIGCFTNGFIKSARINFSAIVKSVGCDQQTFIGRFRSLANLAYEIACEAFIAKGKQIIHEELGCCHTSVTESSHSMLHYYVSTSLGLIQSNTSWMYVHKGPAYHWLLDLFDRMNLPRFDGMAEALKALKAARFKPFLRVKQCDVKCKKRRARKRHRQSEQAARKL